MTDRMLLTLACLLLTFSLLLASCATRPDNSGLARIAVQFGTLKAIEQSESINAEGVLRYTAFARGLVENDVVLDPAKIATEILNAIDTENLSPSDRLLAQTLVLQIQVQFEELDLLDPSTRVTLLSVLEWIEQAARLSV
jgi:hypothetical protein